LLNDGVRSFTEAGIREQVPDVLEPDGPLVQEIVRLARTVHPPRHDELVRVEGQVTIHVREGYGNLGHGEGRRFRGAVEDKVLHDVPAKGLGRLFAQRPTEGIRDVGFAAAVRPDDGAYARAELYARPVGERFKTKNVDCAEMQNTYPNSPSF